MELADVTDSKSVGSDTVRVRPPPPAFTKKCLHSSVRAFSVSVYQFCFDAAASAAIFCRSAA